MSNVTWGDMIAEAEESGDGKPVPNGDYTVRVDSAKYEKSKNNNPMLTCILKVVDEGPAKNGTIWERLTLTKKAAGIFFRGLTAYGISKDDVLRMPKPEHGGMEQLAGLLKGRTARVRVKNDDYGPKVDRYLPSSGAAVAPPTPRAAPAAPAAPEATPSASGKIEPPAPPPDVPF